MNALHHIYNRMLDAFRTLLNRAARAAAGSRRSPRRRATMAGSALVPDVEQRAAEGAGISQLVAETKSYLRKARMSCDGRVRLRGRTRLDICTSPGRAEESINAFERVLAYLSEDGIEFEVRGVDGWRNCAVIDGIAVPLRIRERMHRVQKADRISVAIERMLGGKFPERLVPSGRLELQVMRFGVAVESFPLSGIPSNELLLQIARSVRLAAHREDAHQRRMLATAFSQAAVRMAARDAGPAAVLTALAGPAPGLGELLDRLERPIRQSETYQPAQLAAALNMSESMGRLAGVLQVASVSPTVTKMRVAGGGSLRSRRQRCVA